MRTSFFTQVATLVLTIAVPTIMKQQPASTTKSKVKNPQYRSHCIKCKNTCCSKI